jgi:hypothetical protein
LYLVKQQQQQQRCGHGYLAEMLGSYCVDRCGSLCIKQVSFPFFYLCSIRNFNLAWKFEDHFKS